MPMESLHGQLARDRRRTAIWWITVGIFVAAGAWGYYLHVAGPGRSATGQVVRLASRPDADTPIVLVRVADGSIRQMDIAEYQLARCHVGDRIAVVSVQNTYRVDVHGCDLDERPKP
jgi:hypothetical protein